MKNWLDFLLPTTIDRSKYDGRPVDSRTKRLLLPIPNSFDVLVSFADIGYLSDPQNGCYQMGYVFTMGNMAISWMSTKQMLVATSSN